MKTHSFSARAIAAASTCVLASATLMVPATAQTRAEPAPHPYAASRPVPGRYIVVFKEGVTDPAAEADQIVRGHGGRLHRSYGHALRGFSAWLPEAALDGIRRNPKIAWVEQDQTVSRLQVASPQNQVTWGLDRIDQADLPLDTQYHFSQTGAGVTAFIVDTGIRADHAEFTGRLAPGLGVVADGNGTNDCNGHGTHVAGTVAGSTWGVAKRATVVPVRVLDCAGSGSWSDVIAGIDWLANSPARPAVANLSLGGSASSSLDAAVAGAVARGVTMVVAAGNSNTDACTASPAREPSAITVGATSSTDYRAYFSNTGACVDLFAPGYNITSAGHASPTASATMSGTSMAAPHVAGVAALMLQSNPTATPAAITSALLAAATPNRLQGVGAGSPNLLLATSATSAPVVQPATRTVAFRGMAGSATRSGGNWKASVTVTVRDVATGAAIPNATVSGSFAPGGSTSCVTTAAGQCSLSSGAIKSSSAASTTFSGTGITGSLVKYDASQNSVTQIVIARP